MRLSCIVISAVGRGLYSIYVVVVSLLGVSDILIYILVFDLSVFFVIVTICILFGGNFALFFSQHLTSIL